MGSCYSAQGKGEARPYFTVKPLGRDSPVLKGAREQSLSVSPVKTDREPLPKSVLKNSPNWSHSSSPLFEKKVHRQVSFDLMSELFSEPPSAEATPHHLQREVPAPTITISNQSHPAVNGGTSHNFTVCIRVAR